MCVELFVCLCLRVWFVFGWLCWGRALFACVGLSPCGNESLIRCLFVNFNVYAFGCVCVCLCVCLLAWVLACLCVFSFVVVWLAVCLRACLFVYLFGWLRVCVCVCVFVC